MSWANHSGEVLAAQLEKQGIFGEKTDQSTVLLTFPLLKQGTARIEPFSIQMQQQTEFERIKKDGSLLSIAPYVELDLSYSDQKNKTIVQTYLEEAEGKIAAQNITPYPPGIPLVLKGERLTSEQIKQLEHHLNQSMRVVGLDNNQKLAVFSEND